MQKTLHNRTIFCKDNLEILRGIDTATIDLVYLDPPFNKKKTFTAPLGSNAQGASFKDIFTHADIKEEWLNTIEEDHYPIHELLNAVKNIESRKSYNFCYLAYMAIRLIECHRILKETGSLYLHCDPTMSHYLKLVLDCIFGEEHFRNEIAWKYNWASTTKRSFAKKRDTILFYTKASNYVFNLDAVRIPYTSEQLKNYKKDDGGYYTLDSYHKNKKWYAHPKGQIADDTFFIGVISRSAKERTGYPTQKPLALLERIIKASSNEGDVVLDPFCGCATTCVAAEKLQRQWVGIDVSLKAYELVQTRIKDEVYAEGLLKSEDGALPPIYFKTDPPPRTDRGEYWVEKKYVYIISHPLYQGWYKVGVTQNIKGRLASYQTGVPDQEYTLEYSLETEYFRELETHIHTTFQNRREWVKTDLKSIIHEIETYSP